MIVRIIFVQRRPVIFSKFQTKKTFRRAKNKFQEDSNEEFSFGHKSCKNKRNFGFSLFFRFSGEASSFEKSPSAAKKMFLFCFLARFHLDGSLRRISVVQRQMSLEVLQPDDAILANVALVEAAGILVKPLVLPEKVVRLELCVALRAVEQLADERVGVGDVPRHVVLALERGRAEWAGVAPRDAVVDVTRHEVLPQELLLKETFTAVRTLEDGLHLRVLVRGQQVVPVAALRKRFPVAELK